tara:strand:- start:416 stop:1390 length:975 start_codon:yes stop_codon:yes gene_type:complete
MELKDNIVDKDLSDWIQSIKPLPEWVKLYKLNHHSPSQANTEDDQWAYKYLHLTQEERRLLPINSNMKCGNWIGELAQKKFGSYIWQYERPNGLVKKEIPQEKKIFDTAIDQFNKYTPADDKDKRQHEENKLGFALTWKNCQDAIKEIGLKNPIECERSVALELPDCQLPMIGRVDFEDQYNFIELKTKYKSKNRAKKDGSYSFTLKKIADAKDEKIEKYKGWFQHLLQVAFYYLATRKKPHLAVATEEGYYIYTPENCDQLKPKNLERYLVKMNQVCANREKIMEKHAGKTTWVEDILSNFDHFFWNGMGDHKLKAMRLWGQV